MNLAHIRLVSWIGALALLAGLSWNIWDYLSNYPTWEETQAPQELQVEVLESVQAPSAEKDDLVDYTVVLGGFRTLDWTGKPKAEPVETVQQEEVAAKPPATPVADLLRVLHVRYDSGDPEGCLAFVRYVHPELARANPKDSQLYIGDQLPAPFEYVRVESIEPEGVVFAFDDEGRPQETVAPGEFGDGAKIYIAKVGEDGILERPEQSYIGSQAPDAPPWRPKQTTSIGGGHLKLGYEDVDYIGQNWQEILSREVRTRRHRDPVTGKYDGIEVDSISPGSVAGRHGVQSGDVLKSINGHPVTSKSEAITFVKNNDDRYDTWEVVIERLGREETITYEEPPPN